MLGVLFATNFPRIRTVHPITFSKPPIFFRDALRPSDTGFVVALNDHIIAGSDSNSDPERLDDSIFRASLLHGGNLAVFDVLESIINSNFDKFDGRKGLVILGNMEQDRSKLSINTVIKSAQCQGIPIYVVCPIDNAMEIYINSQPEMATAKDNGEKLSSQTGGLYFRVHNESEFQTALERVANELHSQFLLTYLPSQGSTLKDLRRIKVVPVDHGLKVRTATHIASCTLP
ncbi:MAG TPA: hypothetical protein VKV95_04595 [Terriglobia bacterium]|nr:hypothetical protein [Terriglobia bacterium]